MEQKIPSQHMCKTQCMLGWVIFRLSVKQMLWVVPMHANTTFQILFSWEEGTLSKILGFTQIFQWVLTTHCCNISKLLIVSKYKPLGVPTAKISEN